MNCGWTAEVETEVSSCGWAGAEGAEVAMDLSSTSLYMGYRTEEAPKLLRLEGAF